jgi:hypothetical protein
LLLIHIPLDHGVMHNRVAVLTRQGGVEQLQAFPTHRALDFVQETLIKPHSSPQGGLNLIHENAGLDDSASLPP